MDRFWLASGSLCDHFWLGFDSYRGKGWSAG